MRIFRSERLAAFATKHADCAASLDAWALTVRAARWRSLVDVRGTYRHADPAKVASGRTVTIFNVKGNRYRLVTAIDYALGAVNVIALLTHAEYGKDRWKDSL